MRAGRARACRPWSRPRPAPAPASVIETSIRSTLIFTGAFTSRTRRSPPLPSTSSAPLRSSISLSVRSSVSWLGPWTSRTRTSPRLRIELQRAGDVDDAHLGPPRFDLDRAGLIDLECARAELASDGAGDVREHRLARAPLEDDRRRVGDLDLAAAEGTTHAEALRDADDELDVRSAAHLVGADASRAGSGLAVGLEAEGHGVVRRRAPGLRRRRRRTRGAKR